MNAGSAGMARSNSRLPLPPPPAFEPSGVRMLCSGGGASLRQRAMPPPPPDGASPCAGAAGGGGACATTFTLAASSLALVHRSTHHSMSGRPSSNKGSSVGAAAEAPARSPSGGAGGKRGSALQARAAPPATPQDQPEQQAKRKRELSPPLHVAPSPDTPAAQLVREIHRVARLAAALGFAEARPLILSAIGAYAELGGWWTGGREWGAHRAPSCRGAAAGTGARGHAGTPAGCRDAGAC